jgi:hypothetical protein
MLLARRNQAKVTDKELRVVFRAGFRWVSWTDDLLSMKSIDPFSQTHRNNPRLLRREQMSDDRALTDWMTKKNRNPRPFLFVSRTTLNYSMTPSLARLLMPRARKTFSPILTRLERRHRPRLRILWLR